MKAERNLYANLYVACQSREGDLDNFFAHENHSYPVSISDHGQLNKCNNKSDFLECLEDNTSLEVIPNVDMKVIDGAAFVHMNPPRNFKTYGEYCSVELKEKILLQTKDTRRCDIVFDVYRELSIKAQTRESRGSSVRVSVRDNTPVYGNF